MNNNIYNLVKNPIYIQYENNMTYNEAVGAGNAYSFLVQPTFTLTLITISTKYYVVQIINPPLSGKKIFIESLAMKRTVSGFGLNVTITTNISEYKGGSLTTPQVIPSVNANPSSSNTSVAQVRSKGFQDTSPLSGGVVIENIPMVSSDYVYFYDYSGGIMVPEGATFTVWAQVSVTSLLAVSGSVTLLFAIKYWEEA